MNQTSFVGHTIIVRDKAETLEMRTVVTEHLKDFMIITIKGNLSEYKSNDPITAIILVENGVLEFCGNIRRVKSYPVETEIALFKGQHKEGRAAYRYPVNSPAAVENLVVSRISYPLLDPVNVSVVNLSTTGVLIRGEPYCFLVDTVFEIRMTMDTKETIFHTKVVWAKDSDYGCRFVEVE